MYVQKHRHHQKRKRNKKYPLTAFDYVIYFIAFFAPIITISQLLTVWVDKKIDGVASITWASYAVMAFLWMLYGIKHKEKPIIFSNAMMFVIDTLIVIGVMIQS